MHDRGEGKWRGKVEKKRRSLREGEKEKEKEEGEKEKEKEEEGGGEGEGEGGGGGGGGGGGVEGKRRVKEEERRGWKHLPSLLGVKGCSP